MKRASTLVGSVLIACALAAPAAAQKGGGLYEPFPEARSRQQARDFLERLPGRDALLARSLSDSQLDAGTAVGRGLRVPREGGLASLRAGRPGGDSPLGAAGYLAACLALLAAAGAVAAARRA